MKKYIILTLLLTLCAQSLNGMRRNQRQPNPPKKSTPSKPQPPKKAAVDNDDDDLVQVALTQSTLDEEERQFQQAMAASKTQSSSSSSTALSQKKSSTQMQDDEALALAFLLEEEELSNVTPSRRVPSQEAITIQEEIIGLPAGVHSRMIEGVEVRQLALQAVDRQAWGATCGPRALFIAAALDNLVCKQIVINPITVHQTLEKFGYNDTIKQCDQNYLTPSNEFLDYMTANGITLPNLYVLVPSAPGSEEVIAAGKNDIEGYDFDYLQTIPVQLRAWRDALDNKTLERGSTLQFVCNTGGHWVLFFVVPMQGKPTLWYVNPTNGDIQDNAVLNKYVLYIKTHLGMQ